VAEQRLGLVRAAEIIRADPTLKLPSRIDTRLIDSSASIRQSAPAEIAYQHTVLCQTGLPYRQTDERRWERRNGRVFLEIEAGRALHPTREEFVDLPLPWGPKARLILIYLNSEAIRTQSPIIDVEGSMTAFMRHLQNGRDPTGPEIRKFKQQISALAGATIRMATSIDGQTMQVDNKIVHKFNLWLERRQENQRVLWPETVELSADYFRYLLPHAVPLDQRAVAALSHSALGLDIYTWLAQRLWRVSDRAFVPWVSLHEQFGAGYKHIRQFRKVFLDTMKDVLTQYPEAHLESGPGGLTLRSSPPPVKRILSA
jgi:Plasmid encoded RepA protein